MELKNYMEDLVLQKLDGILAQYPNCCTCDQCKTDIVVLALNNLKPRYVSTHKGTIYARLNEMGAENTIEVVEQVAKAIEIVSRHPRHES